MHLGFSDSNPAPPLMCCVTLDTWLSLSVLEISHCKTEKYLLCKVDENCRSVMFGKCPTWCLVLNRYSAYDCHHSF